MIILRGGNSLDEQIFAFCCESGTICARQIRGIDVI
jgi:hypothetical protein